MADWYVRVNGTPKGPLSLRQIVALLNYGSITYADTAWRAGMPEWLAIQSITEITEFIGDSLVARKDELIAEDSGPFHHVGDAMYLFKMPWKVQVLVSPLAFYIAKIRETLPRNARSRFVNLLIEGLDPRDPAHDARTCVLSNLPESVRLRFLAIEDVSASDIIVIPKSALTCVEVALMNSRVGLRLGRLEITLSASPLRNVRRFLEDHGWKLNQELFPTQSVLLPHPRYIGVKKRLLWVSIVIAAIVALLTVSEWLSSRS